MGLSQYTEEAVRSLWSIGAKYGRTPSPVPEADPWEEEDLLEAPGDEATVEFPGTPAIKVRLCGDLEDTVTLDGYIDFETPRRDTLDLVTAVLAGDARRRPAAGRLLPSFLREMLQGPFGIMLAVPVGGGKVYEQRVASQCLGLTWVTTLTEAH
ncbi:MAG TPA: hypothetical protein VIJ15_11075 [Dermatophilaceae bacterium]